jgi:CheY-like chemotaxis protein
MDPSAQNTSFILLVDDTPENLQLAGSVLSGALSCDLSFATSGPEALAILKDLTPDMILLDVAMPGMTGFEVCREIKANPSTKNIPIIFLTAKAETEDILLGFQLGAADYVPKPFRPAELIARVEVQLRLKRAQHEIRILHGLLSICAGCKKIRTEKGEWQRIEQYITAHSEAQFSHGYCPDCVRIYFPGIGA